KVRTSNLPARALPRRPQQKESLHRTDQQQNIPVPDLQMLDTAVYGSQRTSLIVRRCRNCTGGLYFLQCRLHFTGTLIAQRWFFRQASLNDCYQPRRYSSVQRRWLLMQDGRADFERSPPMKRRLARQGFIKYNSQRP